MLGFVEGCSQTLYLGLIFLKKGSLYRTGLEIQGDPQMKRTVETVI